VFLTDLNTVKHLLPELILVLCGAWLFVGGTWRAERWFWMTFSIASYLIAALALFRQCYGMDPIAEAISTIQISSFGNALRWLALACGILLSLMGISGSRKGLGSEFLGGVMMIVVGLMITARANDLVLLFVGIELVSIPSYMLLFLGRRDRPAAEAAGKYFFLSILASAILLYGFSFLYGVSGATLICGDSQFPGIREKLAEFVSRARPNASLEILPIALVCVTAGLGFKLAAVPFHFYAPDVYQGTTHSNAAILAVAPKIAGLAALLKLSVVTAPAAGDFGWQLMVVVAALTMSIGNMCALWQTNIRRLLAYSSIAHSGYMLMGVAVVMATGAEGVGSEGLGGIASALLYLAMYSFTSIGVFSILSYWYSGDREVIGIEELSGGGQSRPFAAAALAVFMFSFAGIPPLAGFWGKFALFGNTVSQAMAADNHTLQTWFSVLCVIAALNAAIGAAYYLKIVSNLYFKRSDSLAAAGPFWSKPAFASGLACLLIVVGIGLFSRPFVRLAGDAEESMYFRLDSRPTATKSLPENRPIERKEAGEQPSVAALQVPPS
jgi:NADH-quinone oxidoreductase subunit N